MAFKPNAAAISSSAEERSEHLHFTADLVREELWQVQLAEYPESVRLTVADVLDWAGTDVRRLRSIALALQYDVCVWYRIPTMGEVTGCRYGYEGGEYQSGFSTL